MVEVYLCDLGLLIGQGSHRCQCESWRKICMPVNGRRVIQGLLVAVSLPSAQALLLRVPAASRPIRVLSWSSARERPSRVLGVGTGVLKWKARMEGAATHVGEIDREGYRQSPTASMPSPYAQSKSEWAEGNKEGFSVVADYGTAEEVVLPEGIAQLDDGSEGQAPKVRLPMLLQLLDPSRFPSPSTAKKKVRQGVVLVNGRKGKVDSIIAIGRDHITVQARTASKFKPMGEAPFHINVVYEDDVMAVVHKPPGVCTHPPKGQIVPQTQAQSMMSMRCCVPYHVRCAPEGTEGILWRPMMVHRLDKDTEGLQIVAKTKKAYVELQRQFAKRLIKKQYLALVQGRVEGDAGTVDMPVDDKEAISDWRVVSRFRSPALGGCVPS